LAAESAAASVSLGVSQSVLAGVWPWDSQSPWQLVSMLEWKLQSLLQSK
jgi:hypothetical protein